MNKLEVKENKFLLNGKGFKLTMAHPTRWPGYWQIRNISKQYNCIVFLITTIVGAKGCPWNRFGGGIAPRFQNMIVKTLRHCKRFRIIPLFIFGSSKDFGAVTGGDASRSVLDEKYGGPVPKKEKSYRNAWLTNRDMIAMQEDVLKFLVEKIDNQAAAISLLWEANAIAKNPNLKLWLINTLSYIREEKSQHYFRKHKTFDGIYDFPTGVCWYKPNKILEIREKLGFDIFGFHEGTPSFEMRGVAFEDMKRVAYCHGGLNPLRHFSATRPCPGYMKGTEKFINDYGIYMGMLYRLGSVGQLYKRWTNPRFAKQECPLHYNNLNYRKIRKVQAGLIRYYGGLNRVLR